MKQPRLARVVHASLDLRTESSGRRQSALSSLRTECAVCLRRPAKGKLSELAGLKTPEPPALPVGNARPLVPKGHVSIALRFNAGKADEHRRVPKGRLNGDAQLVLSNRPIGTPALCPACPALKRRAIVGSPGTSLLRPYI